MQVSELSPCYILSVPSIIMLSMVFCQYNVYKEARMVRNLFNTNDLQHDRTLSAFIVVFSLIHTQVNEVYLTQLITIEKYLLFNEFK